MLKLECDRLKDEARMVQTRATKEVNTIQQLADEKMAELVKKHKQEMKNVQTKLETEKEELKTSLLKSA